MKSIYIAEIYKIEDINIGPVTYKEFPTFDAALLTMNKLAKLLDLKFIADQSVFGGHYAEKNGVSWGVR